MPQQARGCASGGLERIRTCGPVDRFGSARVIRFHCRCGKRIKVPADVAGKRVRCPFCGRTVRVPRAREDTTPGLEAPVAAVVSGPVGEAPERGGATGLEALAQVVRANGAKPADRSPLAAVRAKAERRELPTSARLISRRVGTIPTHNKAVLIGVIAAVVLFALVIGLSALMAHWSGESEKKPAGQAAPATTGRRSSPGELFKNVPFEK